MSKIFLLENANSIGQLFREFHYDDDRSINIKDDSPLVLENEGPKTQKKTNRAPGDDDADPDDENCY